jgi:hypothetical protein
MLRLIVVVLMCSRVAFAHQTSVKYVEVATDGTRATITLRVAPADLTEPMHLPADATPSAAAAASSPDVAGYVARWAAITSWNEPCPASPPRAVPDASLVAVTWQVQCARLPDTLELSALFAIDRRHVAMVQLVDEDRATIVRADAPRLALRERPSRWAWIASGMDHIYSGTDHVCFVLALLLVVMLTRDATGWQLRPLAATARATATVITAFTVAHSCSLILAALGWVTLPSRLVESAIALSIAYTAAEDAVRPDVRWRFALTFAFGLVHGLGFASNLAVLLPPHDVVVPLLCFNLGVELGQLTIVAVALPALFALARALGAARYRRTVLPACAAGLFAAGIYWFFERAL